MPSFYLENGTYCHINQPATTKYCVVVDCPTCERPRRMLVVYAEWYGGTLTCAGCGDQWSDGEMHERPFERAWRRHNTEYARKELGKIGIPA